MTSYFAHCSTHKGNTSSNQVAGTTPLLMDRPHATPKGAGVRSASRTSLPRVTPNPPRTGTPQGMRSLSVDSPLPTPRRASKAQLLAFKEHLPNTYIHTVSVEAVLAPIAQQLSNLIMIVARAEKAGTAIRDLTPFARSITKACDNLVSVGHASMAEGDDDLKTTMPRSCRELEGASATFTRATEMLTSDPKSAAGRETLVEAVRGMLRGTTSILANYDGFEVRKMVRMGNTLLGQLSVAQLHAKGARESPLTEIDPIAARIKADTIELAKNVDERAGELRNVSHSARLTRAVARMQATAPLVIVSLRTVARFAVSQRARDGFDFAVAEMQRAISEIVTVLNFTAIDDMTFEEKGGSLANALEDVKEELYTVPDELHLERLESQVMMAVAESALAARKFRSVSRIETVLHDMDVLIDEEKGNGSASDGQRLRVLTVARDKIATGALSDDEVGHILETEFNATGETETTRTDKPTKVTEACEALRKLLAELKANPTEEKLEEVASELEQLEATYRAASVEEMTSALLSDEHAADLLVEVSEKGDVEELKAQVVQFRRHTARVTSAAQLVSKVSHDAKRVSFVESTAEHLLQVSDQLVNASMLTVEAPTDKDVRKQQDLLRRSYNGDLTTLKNSVNEMVDTQVVINADLDFVQGMASTAIKAAQQGYAAAARAAVRKLRKRVGHVITVAAAELDNTVDPDYSAAIDTVLSSIEDIDPKLGESTKRLQKNPADKALVADFTDTCTALVDAVRSLREVMEGPAVSSPAPVLEKAARVALAQQDAEADARDAAEDAVFQVVPAPQAQHVTLVSAPTGPTDKDGDGASTTMTTPASPTAAAATTAPTVPATPGSPSSPSTLDDSLQFAAYAGGPEAETPGAPVVRAAVKLRREANKWSEVKNPIVQHAKRMATHMAKMGHISGRDKMGEMIELAQAIAADGNGLRKTALALADRCSDKRLKEDIASLCSRIQTIGVQLNIVASVKATCGEEDAPQSDAMLCNSAQNLMDAAQHLVRACEASSLKLMPTKEDADNDLEVVWRKRKAGARTSALFRRHGVGTPM
eukprot:m.178914 g.178914  ORF g.178914 m.178914 type:complete len:1056 (+) comp14651_c0_seq1:157-3324(+)